MKGLTAGRAILPAQFVTQPSPRRPITRRSAVCYKGFNDLSRLCERAGVSLTPLHETVGVRVEGLDLTQPLTEEHQQILLLALDQHDALLFRGKELTPADEERAVRYYPHDSKAVDDQLFLNGYWHTRAVDNPLVVMRGSFTKMENYYGVTTDAYEKHHFNRFIDDSYLYHIDLADAVHCPEISSMYMDTPTTSGGETIFMPTHRFLASLPPDELKYLESLRWSCIRARYPMALKHMHINPEGTMRTDDLEHWLEEARQKGELNDPIYRPIITHDSQTGKKCMLVTPFQVDHIDGMSGPDSRQLISNLVQRMIDFEGVYTHTWEKGDFVVWANRRLLHSSTPVTRFLGQPRLFHLIFLNAHPDRPVIPANPNLPVHQGGPVATPVVNPLTANNETT